MGIDASRSGLPVWHWAAGLLVIVAIYHVFDALQAVVAQVLRGYKRATAPMAIYMVSLWGVGLAGGYVLGLTDLLGAPRGAAGFWIAATASLLCAGILLALYFDRVSRMPMRRSTSAEFLC